MSKPSITAVTAHYGLHPHGRPGTWQKITCPFHEDGVASATIHEDYCTFYCHACQLNLDSFGFLMRIENIDFTEALNVAERLGFDDTATGEAGSGSSDLRKATGRRRQGLPSRKRTGQNRRFRPTWLRA